MIKDLVRKNRSYRGFNQARRVTKEELADMVDCARLAASSLNAQPLKYYAVWEQEEVDKILPLTKWAKALTDIQLPHPGMGPTAFIIILQDTAISDNFPRHQRDVGAAAQTILLRATEMGLGGCMIGSYGAAPLREALSLPDHLSPLLVVAIGEPVETVVIREIEPGESTKYYRDENDVHYVPKRKLEDVLVSRENLK